MAAQRETTIYDIARALNLSPSTVSRGLRNHPAIKKETVARIQEAAVKMHYQQNTFASKLRSNRSNTIGIVLPRFESSFLSSVVSGIEKEVRDRGYHLLVSQSFDSYKMEKENLKVMFDSRVEGILINLTPETKDLNHLIPLIRKGIPIVLFDRVFNDPDCACTNISVNNRKAAYEVTMHLIGQGCRRIVYLGENTTCSVFGERARGYWDALEESGLDRDPGLVIEEHLNTDTGALVLDRILEMDPRPDAVFAGNDMAAVSLMYELKKAGIRIPEDMAIAGFNNSYLSQMIEPGLTTVNYPSSEMGRLAAISLLDLMRKGKSKITEHIFVGHELIIRGSSLRAGSSR